MARHFLSIKDLSASELVVLLERAIQLKAMVRQGEVYEPLKNGTLAMIFEKSSTRTRVSFEVAATQFGGNALFIAPADSQLCRGEPVSDTARVLSSMCDAIVMRTHSHERLEELVQNSSVPVINGLSDRFHPCQMLADLQTYIEHRGDIWGKTVAWVGDGNNVCNSWINASERFGFKLNISTPSGYEADEVLIAQHDNLVTTFTKPQDAVENSDIVVTDTWASMGQENEKEQRLKAFKDFSITSDLMKLADSDAVFMHCLPAYRGCEVSAEVIDGKQSVVWDQAENRLHAQKALLEFLLLDNRA
ncbi:MAG: ornithine carbamoyltransferase [Parasphingorhabdus sp.]|jgi:ornithine carbamoyltransferase